MSSTGQQIDAQSKNTDKITASLNLLAGEIGVSREALSQEISNLRKSNETLSKAQSKLTGALIVVALIQAAMVGVQAWAMIAKH